MTPLRLLELSRAHLAESAWIKGSIGLSPKDAHHMHCAYGAILCVRGSGARFVDAPIQAAERILCQTRTTKKSALISIVDFNDDPATTLTDVLNVFDAAIAAQKKGAS